MFGKNITLSKDNKNTKEDINKPRRFKARRHFPRRNRTDIKNYNKLIKMKGAFDSLSVTFIYPSGAKKVMDIRPEFLEDRKGKQLTEAKIISKLNTLKHDFLAEKYYINKI